MKYYLLGSLLAVMLIAYPLLRDMKAFGGSTQSIGGNTFGAIKDVNCASPSNNQGITWDSTSEMFICEQLDHGQMAGLNDADHNAAYFQESEFLNTSAGAGDAGKPVKLDADGDIPANMINSVDVDHDSTTNFAANEHFTEASIDHGSIAGTADDDHTEYISADNSGEITAITEKTTPVKDDEFLIEDSAASNVKKSVKLSNVLAAGHGLVEEISGHILSPSNDDFFIVLNAKYARQITDISIKCGSGTITAALEIDGTVITTCTGISVTSTEGTTTCDTGSSNDLAAGETLELVTSSDSSCADLVFTIKTSRD